MMVGWNQDMGEIEKLDSKGPTHHHLVKPPSFGQATIILYCCE